MIRGDVWTAATGSGFGSKPRPVVIMQQEAYGDTPNVLVVLCQSARRDPNDVRPRVMPNPSNGLREQTDVAVDIVVAVPRQKFGARIGQLDADDFARVEAALLTILGFG